MSTLQTNGFQNDGARSPLRRFEQFLQNKATGNDGTILSVMISNGQFKALSIVDHQVHRGWEKPESVESPDLLRQALIDAIHHTEFPGSRLAILIDHKQFLTRTVQLPPMPLPDLLPVLARKAEQEKVWDGPPAWRYRLGSVVRGKQNVNLEIWPQRFIDDLVDICQEIGLQLQQLAPLSALSESQLSTLLVEPGEGTLLITILDGKIRLVAGNDASEPLLTRQLLPALEGIPLGERVATEANRTLLFVNQQTNIPISQIWFLGEEGTLSIEDVQPHITTPILPCPLVPDWKYWLWVGATLPAGLDNNFTPSHVLRAPLRHVFTTTAAAAIAGLLLLGVGTTGMLEGYVSKSRGNVQAAIQHMQVLQQDQQWWQGQLVTLQTKRQWVQTVAGTKPASLGGPFLGYLGTILPPQTILNKASVIHTNTSWEVELSGSISTNLSESLSLLEHLATQLADGPYHVTIQQDWREQLLTQTAASSTPSQPEQRYRFTLKGHIT